LIKRKLFFCSLNKKKKLINDPKLQEEKTGRYADVFNKRKNLLFFFILRNVNFILKIIASVGKKERKSSQDKFSYSISVCFAFDRRKYSCFIFYLFYNKKLSASLTSSKLIKFLIYHLLFFSQ
jgi:hypothetical protein